VAEESDAEAGRGRPDRGYPRMSNPEEGLENRAEGLGSLNGAQDSATRVLYIVGFGRSGSTILEKTIGQVPGIVSVGELHYLWERGIAADWICGCGKRHRDCGFWSSVFESMPADARDSANVQRLQRSIVRLRQYPKLQLGLLGQSSRAYGRVLRGTYRAIASTASARIVVDSSKIVPQAYVALNEPGVDLNVLHIVRDPRAVAYSWRRTKLQESGSAQYMRRWAPTASSLMWLATNALVEVTLKPRLGRKYYRVLYEDFVNRPRSILADILKWLGVDDDLAFFRDESTVVLADTHTVSGNPARFHRGPITIKADQEWLTEMSARHKFEATMAATPLLQRYGYELRPSLTHSRGRA
jgi:hypothetical protein